MRKRKHALLSALIVGMAIITLATAGCSTSPAGRQGYGYGPGGPNANYTPHMVGAGDKKPAIVRTAYSPNSGGSPNYLPNPNTSHQGGHPKASLGDPDGMQTKVHRVFRHSAPALPPQDPGGPPLPTELAPVSIPAYTVAPPDILYIEVDRLLPRPPYRVQPLEIMNIFVSEALPNQPIEGKFTVAPEGTINLGFSYGSVKVGGMTIDQAQSAIQKHLGKVIQNADVRISVEKFQGLSSVRGEYLVRPDGSVSLGSYGSVYVAGMSLGQIKSVIEQYLGQFLVTPRVAVDVLAYNSKKYYVIADGGGFGQSVIAFPYTGNETVLDAVSKVNGLPAVASKKYIWVARPGPAHLECSQILPVDWRAITENGQTRTNWQLMPGDRVYVRADPLIRADNFLAKILSPVERILGITLLGSSTVNSFRNNGNTGIIAGF